MSSGILSFANTKFISQAEHKILSTRCNPQKGDLLISKVGTTGIPLIIDTDKEFSIFVSLALIKFFNQYINNKFLLILLNSPFVQKQIKRDTRGVGNKNWVLTAISNTLMLLPPLSEQKRIVAKIEELMTIADKFEKAKIELDQLESELQPQLKKSVLQYAIQGKLVAQDPTDEPASELLKRIEAEKEQLIKEGKIKRDKNASIIFKGDDNKYYEKKGTEIVCIDEEIPFEIPDSWRWTTIGDLLQIQTGASFKKEEVNRNNVGVRILRGGNIISGSYVFKDDDIFINKDLVNKSILLRKNDLITPAVTSIENVGKIARIINDYESVSAGGFVFILRLFLQNDIISQYLYFVIQSPIITDKIKSITKKSGSAFYNIGKERLLKIYIPLPPIEEQQRIVEKIIKIHKGIED